MSFWSRLLGIETKSTPATVTATPDVVNSWRYVGGGWDGYGHIYQRQPAVRTVVDFLANNVAQLKPKMYMRIDNADRLELPDHRMAIQLANPNPNTTPYRLWRDTVADKGIYDIAYWRKIRSRGLIRAIVRIPPTQLMLEYNEQTKRRIYRLSDGTIVERDDLVIFSGYHPDGSEDGVSPLETLRRVLAEEWAATNHRENFWRNAARQGGVIERPLDAPAWDDVAAKRFREGWQSAMAGGANAGKTAVLEDGMKWNSSAFSPKDSEYIEGRKLTYQEVARAYAPALVGLMSDETRANVESFHRQLYQDVLAPITRSLEDELELQLLPEFEFTPARRAQVYVEFNLQEKLRGSFEEQAKALVTAVGVPYLGVNEARAMLNRPRVADDTLDVPVKPMNVMYGNQPAVTVPTDDPGTSLRSQEITTKLAEFYDRQKDSLVKLLGSLDDRRPAAVIAAWNSKRWNAELTKVLLKAMPLDDAERIAEELNTSNRDHVASVLWEGGLDAVRAVFDEAKELGLSQSRQPRAVPQLTL